MKAYQSLSRETFGTLQSHLLPVYFGTTTLLSSTLLLTHLWFHPSLISSPRVPPHWATSEEGQQGLLIIASLIPSLINWIYVGPKATEIMFERHRLERLEGKEYDDPSPSESMNKLNKKFATLHGISSSLNVIAFLALGGLGLAISM
ncbi:hypothetical protein M231_03979 [Tremella mesenterica]|uniref:TMEM205-like domain-containing protein n=2 Tax=Tremella mesenterica TaxID=5217 RepID=A0A4Q1BLW5_TREME|nr:hypothetical protein M231_03979 [Tremella mesenterica]